MGAPKINIDIDELADRSAVVRIIDVRKEPALRESGRLISGAEWRHPLEVDRWAPDVDGPVVVYCVHGHEVSQGVAAYLRARGIDARYLDGGFEAYARTGGATVPL